MPAVLRKKGSRCTPDRRRHPRLGSYFPASSYVRVSAWRGGVLTVFNGAGCCTEGVSRRSYGRSTGFRRGGMDYAYRNQMHEERTRSERCNVKREK